MDDSKLIDIVITEYNSCRTEIYLHLRYNYITIGLMIGYATSLAGVYANVGLGNDAPDFAPVAAIPYFAVAIIFYLQLIFIARLANYVHVALNDRLGQLPRALRPAFGWEEYVSHRRRAIGTRVLGLANTIFKVFITLLLPLFIYYYGRSKSGGFINVLKIREFEIFLSDIINVIFAVVVVFLMWFTASLYRQITTYRGVDSKKYF